jgi:hypothetical protein
MTTKRIKSRKILVRLTALVAALGSVALGLSISTPQASASTSQPYCLRAALRSNANGLYVSAELGWAGSAYGDLRARSTSIGSWERFSICTAGSGQPDSITSLANGLKVSAEIGTDSRLRARASSVGSWEQFELDILTEASAGGPVVAIKSDANGQFVSAELNMQGLLRARANSVNSWEKFTLVLI